MANLTKRYGEVVAVLVVLISILPVYLAYRLTREEGAAVAAVAPAVAA